MKKLLIPSVLLSLLLTQCQSSAAPAGEAGRGLDAFWQTNTEEEAESVAPALSAQAGDVDTLYTWLSATPNYPADAPVGQVSLSRTDASGTEFPYVLLVPEDYKPSRAYPVEFNLHGGVNRPKIQPGESAWRGGYDSLKKADRIVVVPVAWSEALCAELEALGHPVACYFYNGVPHTFNGPTDELFMGRMIDFFREN